MAFYDRIAKQWRAATGFAGGAFKQFVLNDLLIDAIQFVSGRCILELGAGNGYFWPLVQRRYSGQSPARLVISDQSQRQLELAQKHCMVKGAEYVQLDVRNEFPFESAAFDLIIATMVFNEISKRGVASAVAECRRVLRVGGQLLATVIHPDFVASLEKRGQLRRQRSGVLTMTGSGRMRLPLCRTGRAIYERCLNTSGFEFTAQNVFATKEVVSAKAGLKKLGNVPLALVFDCTRRHRRLS
jgi:SAM-dependent methyltransferase